MKTKLKTAALIALAAGTITNTALAAEYKIDQAHTYAGFAIEHFGASINRGRFDTAEGTIEFDKASKKGKIDISIKVDSLYSGSKDFDEHLKSADIFDAAKYPTIRFVSEKLEFKGKKLIKAKGQLTIKDKTLPVEFKANQFNCYDNPMAKTEACGGDFEATIDRTKWGVDYGIKFGIPAKMTISATVEAFKQ